MSKYEKVQYYYTNGLWDIERVENAVVKGWITKPQFEIITGQTWSTTESEVVE